RPRRVQLLLEVGSRASGDQLADPASEDEAGVGGIDDGALPKLQQADVAVGDREVPRDLLDVFFQLFFFFKHGFSRWEMALERLMSQGRCLTALHGTIIALARRFPAR